MRTGILQQAGKAKEKTEKANEKEQIMLAYTSASMESSIGNNVISKDDIQNELNSSLGQNKATVTSCGKGFNILINDKNYYYTIEEDGTITEPTQVIDIQYAGDITKNGQYDGTTLEKAYRIECIEDLVAFSNDSKTNNFEGLYVVLTRDLNFLSVYSYDNYKTTVFGDINGKSDDGNELLTEMTTGTGFIPISHFKGTFTTVGNEILAIKNIYEKRTGDAGFFMSVENSTVENLRITGKISGNRVGGISVNAKETSIIKNCYNLIEIYGKATDAAVTSGIGGIVGVLSENSTIINCHNYGDISGGDILGGIAGRSKGIIKDSSNNAKIINATKIGGKGYAGGICAISAGSMICNCFNTGEIYSPYGAAGIVTYISDDNLNIVNCSNSAKISGNENQYSYQGGIIGYISGTSSHMVQVINCYNIGEISSSGTNGGIVGDIWQFRENLDIYIKNCINIGNITRKKI